MLIILGRTVPLGRRWARKSARLTGDFRVISPATVDRVQNVQGTALLVPAEAWEQPGRGLSAEEAEVILQCFVHSERTLGEAGQILKDCIDRESRVRTV